MRLIHCADIHLDSRMNANLSKEKAKERRTELLHTFRRMVEYARTEGIEAILIAGDLLTPEMFLLRQGILCGI